MACAYAALRNRSEDEVVGKEDFDWPISTRELV
jgi:hypothetical protein